MAYDTSIVSPEKSGHSDILLTYFCLQSVPIVTTDHEMVIYRRPLVSVLSNRGVTSRDSIIAFTIPELEVGTVLVDIVPESDKRQCESCVGWDWWVDTSACQQGKAAGKSLSVKTDQPSY